MRRHLFHFGQRSLIDGGVAPPAGIWGPSGGLCDGLDLAALPLRSSLVGLSKPGRLIGDPDPEQDLFRSGSRDGPRDHLT